MKVYVKGVFTPAASCVNAYVRFKPRKIAKLTVL